MRNNYASLPLWFHEGLAEYYSTFEVGKDAARIGLPVPEHIQWLRKNPPMPLASLFAVDEHGRDYNEATRRGGFYAQSWALVHYLISGNAERRLQAIESLRMAQAGIPPDQIFKRAFGTDLPALERELRNYVKSYLFATTLSARACPSGTEANLAMEAAPMAWTEVLFRLGDLLANTGSEHAPAAEESLPRGPRRAAGPRTRHGRARPSSKSSPAAAEAARPLYEKAAQLAPGDFLVQYLYARNLTRRARAGLPAEGAGRAHQSRRDCVPTSARPGRGWATPIRPRTSCPPRRSRSWRRPTGSCPPAWTSPTTWRSPTPVPASGRRPRP